MDLLSVGRHYLFFAAEVSAIGRLPVRQCQWRMPALTRRRDLEAPDECWHVYYGNVRIGTIAKRVGIPITEDSWGWAIGSGWQGAATSNCPAFNSGDGQPRVKFSELPKVPDRGRHQLAASFIRYPFPTLGSPLVSPGFAGCQVPVDGRQRVG
jgi:hypothetical protein